MIILIIIIIIIIIITVIILIIIIIIIIISNLQVDTRCKLSLERLGFINPVTIIKQVIDTQVPVTNLSLAENGQSDFLK